VAAPSVSVCGAAVSSLVALHTLRPGRYEPVAIPSIHSLYRTHGFYCFYVRRLNGSGSYFPASGWTVIILELRGVTTAGDTGDASPVHPTMSPLPPNDNRQFVFGVDF